MEAKNNPMRHAAVAMKLEGKSNREIAEALGLKKATADKYVRQAGLSGWEEEKRRSEDITAKVAELREQGLPFREIAEILGIHKTTAMHHAKKTGHGGRRDMMQIRKLYADIILMKESGLSNREVSERTGLPYNSVRTYLWRAGYSTQQYRWLHLRVPKNVYLALKAAAEVRSCKPEGVTKMLLEVIIKDKLIDSILDDGDER